jgi:hypothetical protein
LIADAASSCATFRQKRYNSAAAGKPRRRGADITGGGSCAQQNTI